MEEIFQTAVIIATAGRPEVVRALVDLLIGQQTQKPDHIFVIGSRPEDVASFTEPTQNVTVSVARRGLTLQRNDGLSLAGGAYKNIVFFDDDFIPSRFWIERTNKLLRSRPDISGATGTILSDGASNAGIDMNEGLALVDQRDAAGGEPAQGDEPARLGGNIGCNMAFRYSALRSQRFDERLPAYAWLEDLDMLGQVSRHGPFLRAKNLWGVHLGHKNGRSRGVPLGYSQIANAVYLARKGTVPVRHVAKNAVQNLLSNAVRSLSPEPFVDRRGRLRGNVIALGDLLRGRLAPERIAGL